MNPTNQLGALPKRDDPLPAEDESMETRSGLPEFDPEAVEFNGSLLRPTEDSFRNCSKNDI